MTKTLTLDAHTKRCTGCGGGLVFCPEEKQLKCKSCGAIEDFEKKRGITKQTILQGQSQEINTQEWAESAKIIKCQNCGAQIQLTQLQFATICPYCQTSYVAENEDIDGIKPSAVVPFEFSQEQAALKFACGVKKKFFVPRAFKKQVPKSKISGIYVPSFLFDANTTTSYTGLLCRQIARTSRNGSVQIDHQYIPISGTRKDQFCNIVVESSSNLTKLQLQSVEPFDMKMAFEYNPAFVMGYSVERYDNMLSNCQKIADSIMCAQIRQNISNSYVSGSVTDLKISVKKYDEKFAYTLLPIYFFEFAFGKKNHVAFMNGQTGKIGSGLPVSKTKVAFSVVGAILLVLFVALIVYFLGG